MKLGIFSLTILGVVLCAVCQAQPKTDPQMAPMKAEAETETLIRQRVENYAKAISAKDINSVVSFFAPNVVSFDIAIKTLQYSGADNKRQEWLKVFDRYRSIVYEIRDFNITAQGELAFVHSLNHMNGTFASGETTDFWVRWTACFRRIDGVWLIVHDHVSVPVDLKHGQAIMNLKP